MAVDNVKVENNVENNVKVEIAAATSVAVVTINRPQVLNALNSATLDELDRCLTDLGRTPAYRVVVLTGAGSKSFVAGPDINELAVQAGTSARRQALAGQRVFQHVEDLGKPVIAAINGFALGGGH